MKLTPINKKGQAMELLSGNIIGLIVAIIILVMGVIIVAELRDSDSIPEGDVAYATANESLVGLGDFSDFVPLIVIAVAASVIIGLILLGFGFMGRER